MSQQVEQQTDELTILDGGLATALEANGFDLNSRLWSAKILQDNPDAICAVHLSYYLAGASVATTASYQASVATLQENLSLTVSESQTLIRKSVSLAQRARDDVLAQYPSRRLLVAGSVGPYGGYLSNGAEYTGDYSLPEAEMQAFHRGRIQALVDAGVDILACETMPSMPEIKALVSLLKNEFPASKAWVSCTLRDAGHLADGTDVAEMVKLVDQSSQVVALGFNCIPEGLATEALDHVRGLGLTRKPLVIYPNSGETYDATSKQWHGERPQGQVGVLAKEWFDRGARYIGGCCRTNAEDIANMAAALR